MSINLKYQYVSHLADLSAYWVVEVVRSSTPVTTLHQPTVITVYHSFRVECHDPHLFAGTLTLIEEQLRFLQVDCFLYLLAHIS